MKIEEKYDQKLLVEGNDDQHIIWTLLKHFAVRESFDVVEKEGYANLFASIPVRLKTSDTRTVGIVVDADTNIQSRWQSINSSLNKFGCSLPEFPPTEGYIGNTTKEPVKRIGVWIMPNNILPGMIEDFLQMLIPNDDSLLQPCNAFLNTLEEQQLHRYGNHRSKALMHTWLAVQEVPGTPMGLAITKRYLSPNHDIAHRFAAWLNELFNGSTQP